MKEERTASFTVSVESQVAVDLFKQARIEEIQKENLLYLYGKYDNSRFLT